MRRAGPELIGSDPTESGVIVQDARTSLMRFSIPQIIEFLGRHLALREGDLISTGTPLRVGPLAERHLQPGDIMTCAIEGIGELTNSIA